MVLGLRSERFDKKVPFEILKDKLIKYMGCEMTMGEYIECLVKNREDPKKRFDKKYMLKPLSSEDK